MLAGVPRRRLFPLLAALAAVQLSSPAAPAQVRARPSVGFVVAPKLTLPGRVDSNNPLVWSLSGADRILTVMTSWGGAPELGRGPSIDALRPAGGVTLLNYPGDGAWFEAIVPDAQGRWYGFYHHERPATACGRPERQLPRIGAARSIDQGRTWEDLGVVLDAPPGSDACQSTNRFVLGGVGDVSAALDPAGQDLYLYFSQYVANPALQGIAVARLAWADRDRPAGRAMVWNDGAWLPPRDAATATSAEAWEFPSGTPLVRATRPFHDSQAAADVYWGAAIHWNTHLQQYVMLMNRARDERFEQDGTYVSYSPTVADPRAWSVPVKIVNGGGWYPQVAGLEPGVGSDTVAGQRARFFLTGVSTAFIEFRR
jgi:hypothetical protein